MDTLQKTGKIWLGRDSRERESYGMQWKEEKYKKEDVWLVGHSYYFNVG